ncbi:MAG: sulfotransferase family 2 domain-containing protein [Phaeodactylibacter sp.]|uniref:sulfotransferase family 2 domain-containing protein n=1 Tax=Phaeodactylibacter sp. TaxID=1940289 RepID=UPI0032EE20A2
MLSSLSIRDYTRLLKRKWYAATGRPYPYLLSIHIPKTAGRTFREILRAQYGHEGVLSLDHHYLKQRNEQLEDYPTSHYPVIHGHLPYQQIARVGLPSSQYLTWLRHPVDRVISNYYFYRTSEYPDLKKKDPTKQLTPFKRFIRREHRRNVMSRYLEGIALEDLFFVGFQEHFNKDVVKLGKKLGWQLAPEHLELRINDNQKAKQALPAPTEELISKICAYNDKDLTLYEKARQLADQGHWD